MKKRISGSWLWLALPLVPLAFFLVVAIWSGKPDPDAIANRGSTPPPARVFSIASPSSWNIALDWMDDGMDSFMGWDMNPWKREKGQRYYGSRLMALKDSTNPADREEYERLMKLGKEWYERILARYPALAPDPARQVADDENGYLKLAELARSLVRGDRSSLIPKLPDWASQIGKKSNDAAWDPAAAAAWVDANRALLDQLHAIGLLGEQSSSGLVAEDIPDEMFMMARHGADALMMEARLAIDRGDIAAALESVRAARGLASHLSDHESPSLLQQLLGFHIVNNIHGFLLNDVIPSLPAGQVDLDAWQAAAGGRVDSTDDLVRVTKGEWNSFMRGYMLPAYSDSTDPDLPPDPDQVAELYTRRMEAAMNDVKGRSIGELETLNLTHISDAGLSRRGRQDMPLPITNGWIERWSRTQTNAGMNVAAFAILQGRPVPNDPISGKPYQWNPETRQLSLPAGIPNRGNRTLTLPRLGGPGNGL